MSLLRIRHPSGRQLAVFGLSWLTSFVLLGWWAWNRVGPVAAAAFWAVGIFTPATGLAYPASLRVVYIAASYATYPFGYVVSHVLLAAVYYLVLSPIGIVMRWFGYDPIKRSFDANARSYWIERRTDNDPGRYLRQF